tara:strand:+ start:68 stop:619 length:552 start_codon:yes stop_codon:yes gene_type:complete
MSSVASMDWVDERVYYPLKDIWQEIAEERGIELRQFEEGSFEREEHREAWPNLADLAIHLAGRQTMGPQYAEMFEGGNEAMALAYHGRRKKLFEGGMREHALLKVGGRRVMVYLHNNGNGEIKIEDPLVSQARWQLGGDSFGSSFDEEPKGKYKFRHEHGAEGLPGVKAFVNYLVDGKVTEER